MTLQPEHLPSEIWLYIFSFFEGHDLIRSFSHLNLFFDSLLRSSHLQLHIRIKKDESDQRLPEPIWSHINLQNIYSLSVGKRKANCLIQFLRWHAQYLIRLRTVSIYLRQLNIYYNTQFLIFALEQLPSLQCIHIKYQGLHTYSFDLNPVLNYIFREKSIINSCSFATVGLDFNNDNFKWSINQHLKYLKIREISFDKLFSILSYTPQLHYLTATIDSSHIVSEQSFTLSQLRKLDLYIFRSPVARLRMLKQAAPYLQYLRVRGCINSDDNDYFNENLWNELLHNIKFFDIEVSGWVYNGEKKQSLTNHIQNYQGKKWFKLKTKNSCLEVIISFKSSMI